MFRAHVSSAYDIDDRLIEHTRRSIEQNQHPLATHLHPGQVLAIAFTGKRTNIIAFAFALFDAPFEPAAFFFLCLEIRLQLIDAVLGRECIVVESRQLYANSFQVLLDGIGKTIGSGILLLQNLDGVPDPDKIFIALENLFFDLLHL